MKFSTFDRDNDRRADSCSAHNNRSGNWFNSCYTMHLTDMPKPQIYNNGFLPYDYAELRVCPKVVQLSVMILIIVSKGKAEGIYTN